MLLELRLKQIRFKQQKKLNEAHLYLYKSISSYIQNSDLRRIEKEEVLQQIMDMMLQAQIENKAMNLFIGNDYEEFCKSIIEEYNSDKSITYKMLNYIQKYLLCMLLMTIFMVVFRKILNPSLDLGIAVDQFVLVNIISFIIFTIGKRNRQETSSLKSFYQRLCAVYVRRESDKVGVYALALMAVIWVFLKFIIGKTFGTEVFNYIITLVSGIPYIGLVLLLIVVIKIYLRTYDRR